MQHDASALSPGGFVGHVVRDQVAADDRRLWGVEQIDTTAAAIGRTGMHTAIVACDYIVDDDGGRILAVDTTACIVTRGITSQAIGIAASDGETIDGRRDVSGNADDPLGPKGIERGAKSFTGRGTAPK